MHFLLFDIRQCFGGFLSKKLQKHLRIREKWRTFAPANEKRVSLGAPRQCPEARSAEE